MPYTKTTWVNGQAPYLNATNLNKLEDGVATAQSTAEAAQTSAGSGGPVSPGTGVAGIVMLDSFAGADDNAKHTAARSYCAAQTYRPLIGLGNRAYTFTGTIGQPYPGYGLWGPQYGWPNREQSVSRCTVTVTVANGPWIDHTAAGYYGYTFGNVEFVGGGTTTQFLRASDSANPMWKFYGQNLGFQNFKGVFGNNTENCFIDLCTFTGPWSMLSPLDTQMRVGGADCIDLWTSGSLNIGGGSTGPVSGTGGGRYLLHFSGLSKSNIGNIYCTADNDWRGALFTGSQSSGYGLAVNGCVFEGRNAATPCNGNLVRVEGGAVDFVNSNVNCGMKAPTAGETALFEVTGADTQVDVTGLTVSHATGVPVTTPVLASSGSAVVRLRNVKRATRSGSPGWGTQLPVATGTAAGIPDRDTSTVAA